MKKTILAVVAAVATIGAANAAQAATLYTQGGSTGELLSPGAVPFTYNTGAGAGQATFNYVGFRSLDGGTGSCCSDVLTVSLNGTPIFSAAYALGGTGANETYLQPTGTVVDLVQTGFTFTGGLAKITLPLSFLAGSNTLNFAVAGVAQGSADEAFGISDLVVTGNAAPGAVPEPATWAMMLLGFGLIGFAMRKRSHVRTTVSYA